MSNLNIAADVAKQLKDIGITAAPTPVEFDALNLGVTSSGLKREYGTYDNGIKEVMKLTSTDVAEEWEEDTTDWQQDMNDEADI